MDWYLIFILAVLLLRLGATARDRSALTVVVVATVASWMLVTFVTHGITGSWKLVIPATVETATILALLRWARTRTGLMQAMLVAVAWYAHLLCYIDIRIGTNMIYDNYERLLGLVAVLQIASCYDTYLHHFRRLGQWWSSFGADRAGVVRAPSVPASVFHHQGDTGA